MEMIIHAFILSRINYCNSIFSCPHEGSVERLQLLQNAAVKLFTRSSQFSLHWFPVKYKKQYKVLVWKYKALYGTAPTYISDIIHRDRTSRSLPVRDYYWFPNVI